MCKTKEEEFIEKAHKVHGDFYDYSKVVYVKNTERVCIICPKHGEFWQTPKNHKKGFGCPECGKEKSYGKATREKYQPVVDARNEAFSSKFTYDDCFKAAQMYQYFLDFVMKSENEYKVARMKGWLQDYTWLKNHEKDEAYFENYQNCLNESKLYSTKIEFSRECQLGYENSLKYGWLDDFVWLKDETFDISKEKVDCVYAYEFEEQHAVYVGRTLMKRKTVRRREHRSHDDDAVYIFAKEYGLTVPEPKYLEENLTLKEGAEHEGLWVEYYRNEGWKILNRNKTGSIGSVGEGRTRFTRQVCYELAKDCYNRTALRDKCRQAYNNALKYGWIDDYTWFKDKATSISEKKMIHDYDFCLNVAKKYTTLKDFQTEDYSIYEAAHRHGWIKDYTWLQRLWEPKWDKDSLFREAQKYSTIKEFRLNCGHGYAKACENGWINDYTWLERAQVKNGTWQDYERNFEEAQKYNTKKEYREGSPSSYKSAWEHGWIKDYTLLKGKKEKRKITYEDCVNCAKSCKTLSEFCRNFSVEYKKSKKNGWLVEFTWLEDDIRKTVELGTWTDYQVCYDEARKYVKYFDFVINSKGCYNSARCNGWIDDYTWLERDPKNNAKNKKPKGYWCVYENCRQEALKYKTLYEFTRLSKTAAESARTHGWLDDFTWLKKKFTIKKKNENNEETDSRVE